MASIPLEPFAKTIAIAAIATYQQYSPYKGFACPHRLLHGGESCSSYVKRLFQEQSLIATLQQMPQRFQACQSAGSILRASKSGSGCIVIPCCIPI